MVTAALASARAAKRARLIKIVQTGRNVLRLDEDTYRDLLAAKSNGKRSAKDLSIDELDAVVKHMRASGFKPTKQAGRAPREQRTLDTSPEGSKIRALWLWLHEVGIVVDPSEAALANFARRISGVDTLQWTHRPDKVIEGIKAWAARQLPAKLSERTATLQAAGQLPSDITADALPLLVCPTLNPAGFDALHRTLNYLVRLENGDIQWR